MQQPHNQPSSKRIRKHTRNLLLVFIAWTAIIAGSLIWNLHDSQKHATDLAVDKARANLANDRILGAWAASHGGVYVPIDGRTTPNPYLTHIPERDITTQSGRRLTLMPPAYLLRQFLEDVSDSEISGHLTSLNPLRPENAPDPWEREALKTLADGAGEVVALTEINGAPFARVMSPLVIKQPICLSCHSKQGYKMGDIRGGLSSSVALKPYLKIAQTERWNALLTHGIIWLLGMGGIGVAGRRNRRQLALQIETEASLSDSRHFLENIINSIQELVLVINKKYEIVLSNSHTHASDAFASDFTVMHCHEFFHQSNEPCADCHLSKTFSGEAVTREKFNALSNKFWEITTYPFRDGSGEITLAIEIVRDISERKEMEKALQASEARFRRFAENAQDIVYRFRIKPQPVIEYISPAVERLTGYTVDQCYADPFVTIRMLHPDDVPIVQNILMGNPPQGDTFISRVISTSGQLVWLEHLTTTILDENGDMEIFEGIARDITQQVKVEQEIRTFNQTLERAVRQRTSELETSTREMEEFCYSISHDLRAPLRAINTYSHIIETECSNAMGSDTCSSNLTRIKTASSHMGILMDQLLELGRISRPRIHSETADLATMGTRIIEDLRKQKPDRSLTFVAPDTMPTVTDRKLAHTLLQKLLENAWKFTSMRTDAVIEIGSFTEGDETIYFIKDNGAGFDMAHVGYLFKPFQRLHRTEEFPGNGIGLAIAKRIIERHGGRIWAEGIPGKGATFAFTLPPPPSYLHGGTSQ